MYGRQSLLNCKLCGKPFETKVELGPRKFPVWIHDYPTLDTCKAIRLQENYVKNLLSRDERIKEFLKQYGPDEKPKPRVFSETADP